MKKVNLYKIVVFLLFLLTLFFVYYFDIHEYFTLENIKEQKSNISKFIENNYWVSVAYFILIYIFLVGFSVPGAVALTLAGGFFFGVIEGAVYSIFSATIGAAFAFLVVRYLIGSFIQERYSNRLSKFNQEFEKNGIYYLITLRLIAIFPFFIINILSGLTKVPLKTFVLATSIGILPGTLVYSYVGRQLGKINSLKDVFSIEVIIAFIILFVFSLLPVFYKKLKFNKKH